jgi:hypothetical protein
VIRLPSVSTKGSFGRRTIAGARDEGSATERAFGAFVVDAPWQVADVSRLLVRLAVALLAVLITWYGAAHTTHINRQFVWIVGGSAGAAIGLIAVVAWETAGLARVRYLKLELTASIQTRYAGSPSAADILAVTTAADSAPAAGWVTAPGMRLYHLPGCQLTLGKPVHAVSRAAVDRTGLKPCGACGA